MKNKVFMEFIREELLEGLTPEESVRVVIVHNNDINEDLYLLLNENEAKDVNLGAIKKFVLDSYASKAFKESDLKLTYYKRNK